MKNLKLKLSVITILIVGTLSGCSLVNTDNSTPTTDKIVAGINLLISQYVKNYNSLVNWDNASVANQLLEKIPPGVPTPAGWLITWDHSKTNQLSSALIPWSILNLYPSQTSNPISIYKDAGKPVAAATYNQLQEIEDQKHPLFSGLVNVKSSINDGSWVIFTEMPYLSVTGPGYGFAHHENGTWKVVDFGTAQVGCGKVPSEIESEFGFTC